MGRATRIGAIVVAVVLLAMLLGNHRGYVEDLWLIGIAAALVGTVVGDWVLRKNGLRS